MSVFEVYGLKPMTFEEELALPEAQRKTRNNKMKVYNDCEHIMRTAEDYMRRVKQIPELDDATHSSIVQEFANDVHSLCEEFLLAYDKHVIKG